MLFAMNRKFLKTGFLKESLERLRFYRYEETLMRYLQNWIDQLRWPRLKLCQKLAEMLLDLNESFPTEPIRG